MLKFNFLIQSLLVWFSCCYKKTGTILPLTAHVCVPGIHSASLHYMLTAWKLNPNLEHVFFSISGCWLTACLVAAAVNFVPFFQRKMPVQKCVCIFFGTVHLRNNQVPWAPNSYVTVSSWGVVFLYWELCFFIYDAQNCSVWTYSET